MIGIDENKMIEAENAYNTGDYSLSTQIYKELWDSSNKKSYKLFSLYGKSLQKNNESKKFIDIYESLDNNLVKENSYVISTLCWCVYGEFIKNYDILDIDNFDNFLKYAKFIVTKISQLELEKYNYNPYVLTVVKVVKVLKKKSSKNYPKIIEWLSLLNPKLLPNDKCFQFTDKSGKERELASYREFYYQYIAESYEKIGDYEKCIAYCNEAFDNIDKFHYRNGLWIQSRKLFSECMILDDKKCALNNYKKMAEKEKLWFMYYKLSTLYMRFAELKYSLLYACKSITGKFEHEKMIKVLLDIGLLLKNTNDFNNANLFFQASAHYRKINFWNIPEELEYEIIQNNIDVDVKPNIHLLQNTAKHYVDKMEDEMKKSGIIVDVKLERYFGFIKDEKTSELIFFRASELKNINFDKTVIGKKIKYYIVEDKQKRQNAIEIRGVNYGNNIK